MAQKVTKDEKEILQDPEGEELPPPPNGMMIPATNAPAGQEPPHRELTRGR